MSLKKFTKEFNLNNKCLLSRVKAKIKLRWFIYGLSLNGRRFRVKIDSNQKANLKRLLSSERTINSEPL